MMLEFFICMLRTECLFLEAVYHFVAKWKMLLIYR